MGLGGSGGGSPIDRQLHQLPHATALEHGLLRGARVKDGAEPEGGVVPGRAHLGMVAVGVFFFLGGVHGSLTPWGGGTYVDGAVAQAVHHLPVPSARLRAGQRPDPKVGGHRGGTVWGPPLRPWTS